MHLIDPWRFNPEFPHTWYGGRIAKNQDDMDGIYQAVRDRFKEHPNVCIHRGESQDVLPSFDGGYLDWVYLDGNHHYEYVLRDLRMCLRAVKRGGIIAGDDYYWQGPARDCPVKCAIRVFAGEHDLRFALAGSQYSIEVW